MAKNDAHACLRLTTMLGRFWLMRGHYAEGRYWLETALYGRQPSRGRTQLRKSRDRVRLEHDQPALFGAALGMAAEIAWYSGDFIAAQTFGEQRLTIARRSGDIGIVADALSHLGYAMTQQGQYEKALPMLEESLALSRQLDDKPRVVAVLLHLSGLASVQGDFSSTRTLGEEALAFARELGDQHSIAVALNTIGFAAYLQGDLAQARPWLEESLEAFQKVGEKWHTSRARWTLGHLARAEGDLVGAHAIFTGELASMREWDSKWPVPYHLEPLAYMAIDAGRHELAACLLGAAQALREASHPLHPALRREYEHHLSALQGALDEPAFAAAWAAGRALSAEAALDYALQETTP
jgi:tetratricopeptide (TPR) repeat protein